MLQDSFIEMHYKRDNGAYGVFFSISIILAAAIFIIVLNAVPILLGYNIIYITGLISAGLIYLVYRAIRNLNVEYEIEISNDQFDVARIIAGRKREDLAAFSIKDCEYIGPTDSDRFKEDSDNSEFVLNVTQDRKVVRSSDIWYAFVEQNSLKYIVAFTFKDEMYSVFRRYNPRKVAPYTVKPVSDNP